MAINPAAMTPALAAEWIMGLKIKSRAMLDVAASLDNRGRNLATATAVISAVVGTAIFSTVSTYPAVGWKIATGLLSLTATVLATLASALGYTGRSTSFRNLAARTGDLRRDAEMACCVKDFAADTWTALSAKWKDLETDGAIVTNAQFTKAEKEIKKEADG